MLFRSLPRGRGHLSRVGSVRPVWKEGDWCILAAIQESKTETLVKSCVVVRFLRDRCGPVIPTSARQCSSRSIMHDPRSLVFAAALLFLSAPVSDSVIPQSERKIWRAYGKLPLSFEANHGQTGPQVKFLSRGSGYRLFLTSREVVLALSGTGLRVSAVEIGRASCRERV